MNNILFKNFRSSSNKQPTVTSGSPPGPKSNRPRPRKVRPAVVTKLNRVRFGGFPKFLTRRQRSPPISRSQRSSEEPEVKKTEGDSKEQPAAKDNNNTSNDQKEKKLS